MTIYVAQHVVVNKFYQGHGKWSDDVRWAKLYREPLPAAPQFGIFVDLVQVGEYTECDGCSLISFHDDMSPDFCMDCGCCNEHCDCTDRCKHCNQIIVTFTKVPKWARIHTDTTEGWGIDCCSDPEHDFICDTREASGWWPKPHELKEPTASVDQILSDLKKMGDL